MIIYLKYDVTYVYKYSLFINKIGYNIIRWSMFTVFQKMCLKFYSPVYRIHSWY